MPPATAERSNTVVVEDVGSSRKRLTITVPAETVAQKLEQSLSTLASEAALPGFRPGRAPRALIEKRFGQSVRGETKNQIVSEAYTAAIQEHKLTVVGEPEPEESLRDAALDPRQPFKFSVEIEVMPEFELPSFEGVEVLRPTIEVTDSQIDEQLNRIRINEGSLQAQEKAARGDYCIGHGVMKNKAGETLIDIDGAVVQVPPDAKDAKGAILGVMVEDFGEQIGLPKPGDTLHIKTHGPENHEDERVRGQDLRIEFKVARVERIMPASDDQLVARFGTGDEAQLRELITLRLHQRAMVEQQAAVRQQVARKLVESVEFPLPERLSARQAERLLSRTRMDLMYRGYTEPQIEERLAELRGASAERAQEELKLFFILNRFADSLEVGVSQDEVLGRISQIAAERGVRPDDIRKQLTQRAQIMAIANQIREHKTLDVLAARAKIVDVPQEEFNERTKGAAASARKGGKPEASDAPAKGKTKGKADKRK